MIVRVPTKQEIEEVTGLPAASWEGKCHAVCATALRAGLVPGGRLTRGHWRGPISSRSVFTGRAFTQHSWIRLPDGWIIDPTRWAFFNGIAAVWFGQPEGDWYDPGGNRLREATEKRCPPFDGTVAAELDLEPLGSLRGMLFSLLNYKSRSEHFNELPFGPNEAQIFWLANLSPRALGPLAVPLFRAISASPYRAAIPIDNLHLVLNEPYPEELPECTPPPRTPNP